MPEVHSALSTTPLLLLRTQHLIAQPKTKPSLNPLLIPQDPLRMGRSNLSPMKGQRWRSLQWALR
jgi:hypothetical protein